MDDRSTRAAREALIVADRGADLSTAEADEVPLLAEVLADPATWVTPRAALEVDVLRAVAAAEPRRVTKLRASHASGAIARPARRRRMSGIGAAVGAVAAALVMLLAFSGRSAVAFEGTLAATELAPGASGSVGVTSNRAGFDVTLVARGLSPLPAGSFYQAWLKSPSGTLVPIGSFSSSDDEVTLWSGVSPSDFPTFTVTIESMDNDQRSSGRRVLVGALTRR